MTENNETEMLRVILCKPGETAEVVEIDDDLESMQELRLLDYRIRLAVVSRHIHRIYVIW